MYVVQSLIFCYLHRRENLKTVGMEIVYRRCRRLVDVSRRLLLLSLYLLLSLSHPFCSHVSVLVAHVTRP